MIGPKDFGENRVSIFVFLNEKSDDIEIQVWAWDLNNLREITFNDESFRSFSFRDPWIIYPSPQIGTPIEPLYIFSSEGITTLKDVRKQ